MEEKQEQQENEEERERDCNPSTQSLPSSAAESPGGEPSPQAGRQEVQWLSAWPRFQICRSPYVSPSEVILNLLIPVSS